MRSDTMEPKNNIDAVTSAERKTVDVEYTYKEKPVYAFLKRCGDIFCSVMALIVLSPLFLTVAVLIKREDGGPVIFAQERLTKNGKIFKMYKFRTMCEDAESKLEELRPYNEVDGPVFKIREDPRVTKIGHILRRTSIDELPQLVNILIGDMAVVGPRPPLPDEVAKYTPYQRHRLDVKGGLTCYWQISGRSNLGFEDWVALDLKYIMERGVLTDIKMIFKTVLEVMKMTGAM